MYHQLTELKLLSSSGQGDTSSCQSLVCKPYNTAWPLTPKGVSHFFSHLYTMETQKLQLRPTCCFFFHLGFLSLWQLVYFALLHLWSYTVHHSSSWQLLYLELKIWPLYNKSLPPPCGHYAHSTGLDCFAAPLELWIMWIKISDITSQWVLFNLHCSLIQIMGCDHYVITTMYKYMCSCMQWSKWLTNEEIKQSRSNTVFYWPTKL